MAQPLDVERGGSTTIVSGISKPSRSLDEDCIALSKGGGGTSSRSSPGMRGPSGEPLDFVIKAGARNCRSSQLREAIKGNLMHYSASGPDVVVHPTTC